MTDWTDREMVAERDMHALGVQRYYAKLNRLRERRKESYSRPATQVVRHAIAATAAAIGKWRRSQSRTAVARRHACYDVMRTVPTKPAALIVLRSCFDLAAAGKKYGAACSEIGGRLETEAMGLWVRKHARLDWDRIKRHVNKRKDVVQACLRDRSIETGFVRWSPKERAQAGMLVVDLVERTTGLVRVRTKRSSRRRSQHVLEVDPKVADWVAAGHAKVEGLQPLYLPMVDPPAPWGPDEQGGYATPMIKREWLVKAESRKTKALIRDAKMPAVYEAVNAIQGTEWELDPAVLEVARTLWEEADPPSLPSADDEEAQPWREDMTAEEFRERRATMERNASRRGARLELSRVLWAANYLDRRGGSLYFPQQLDFRGRVYPLPLFLTPQGGDLARGLLRFKRGCMVAEGTPAARALMVHGANVGGFDKAGLDEREAWARDRRMQALSVAADPLDDRSWEEADEPWKFLAWCLDAAPLFEEGRTWSHVPVYADGSNNGTQILSLLLGDEVGAAATNCLPGLPFRDIYQDVADETTRRLRADPSDLARAWLAYCEGRLPRSFAKRPVMTLPYGCTVWSARQYVMDWADQDMLARGVRGPWNSQPHAWAMVNYLVDVLWDAIRELVGRAMDLMDWFQRAADATVDGGAAPQWVAPSGFPVRQAYTKYAVQTVRTTLGDRARYVRLRSDGTLLDARRHRQGLAPNFVHSLDAALLAMAVSRARELGVDQVSTIHDAYGAPADQIGTLVRCVRSAYVEVFTENQLEILRNQLASAVGARYTMPELPARGTLDVRAVLDADLMFS